MLCIWFNIKRNVVYLSWFINNKIRFNAKQIINLSNKQFNWKQIKTVAIFSIESHMLIRDC